MKGGEGAAGRRTVGQGRCASAWDGRGKFA